MRARHSRNGWPAWWGRSWPRARLALPGARAIAETLRRRGIPVAVSSNSPRRFVDTALRSAGLHDLFEVVVPAEDAEHGKARLSLRRATAMLARE